MRVTPDGSKEREAMAKQWWHGNSQGAREAMEATQARIDAREAEIERLTAENEEFRAALESIAAVHVDSKTDYCQLLSICVAIAKIGLR